MLKYIGLMAVLSGCSTASFSGSGSAGAATSPGSVDANAALPTSTETFKTAGTTPAVDLVWVVDNSDTMEYGAARIRDRFNTLVNELDTYTSLQLAVISQPDGATGLAIPAGLTFSTLQIPQRVESTNTAAIAASASCAQNSTDASNAASARVCNQNAVGTLEDAAAVQAVRGELLPFFRHGAARTYVFVSDDNPSGIDDQNFLSAVKTSDALSTRVFAFRGEVSRGAQCPSVHAGHAYDTLAAATSGAVYDICPRKESDWDTNISAFRDTLVSVSTEGFQLKNNAGVQIISVSVDGNTIPATDYSFNGQKLHIARSLITRVGQDISVTYQFTKTI